MRKRLIIPLFFLLTIIIYSSDLHIYYNNYISSNDEIKTVKNNILKNEYERRVIVSQSFPRLIFNTNYSKYSGVYDLNNIQAKYLNFTFDVDVNFAKNLHIEFTILQNLYSGEKIYDLKRMNKKKGDLLLIKKAKTDFQVLKEFLERYNELLSLENGIKLMRVNYELAKSRWLKMKNRIAKNSNEALLNEKKLENLKYLYTLKSNEFKKKYNDFKDKTKIKELKPFGIYWLYDIFEFNKDFVYARSLKENILLLNIKKRLNSDNFKPTIDLFFKYGLQDDNMEVLEDGYTAGIVFNWNIFDGFKDHNKNKILEIDINQREEDLQHLIDDSKAEYSFLMDRIKVLEDYYENEKEIMDITEDNFNRDKSDLEKGNISIEAFWKSKKNYLEEKQKYLEYVKKYVYTIYNISLLSDNLSGFWKVVK